MGSEFKVQKHDHLICLLRDPFAVDAAFYVKVHWYKSYGAQLSVPRAQRNAGAAIEFRSLGNAFLQL